MNRYDNCVCGHTLASSRFWTEAAINDLLAARRFLKARALTDTREGADENCNLDSHPWSAKTALRGQPGSLAKGKRL